LAPTFLSLADEESLFAFPYARRFRFGVIPSGAFWREESAVSFL
jgi:hypothetical protein